MSARDEIGQWDEIGGWLDSDAAPVPGWNVLPVQCGFEVTIARLNSLVPKEKP